MSITLKNSANTTTYIFPKGCNIVSEPYDYRLDTEARTYQHGAVIVGDGKVEPRIVTLHGLFNVSMVDATYGATIIANLREMHQQCYASVVRLYPGAQYTDEYYTVKCFHFGHSYVGTVGNVEVDIDFLVADPFRYYKDETTDSNTVDESPEAFTVSNGGDIEVFPVITWTAGAAANFSKVRIANAEDGGKYFEYEPAANIENGDVIEFDFQEGTVELNGSSDMAHFTGSFIKLASGTNNITVTLTGTPGTNDCSFVFRKRWL